jgi:ABC-type sugar transport system substrate-binding protein
MRVRLTLAAAALAVASGSTVAFAAAGPPPVGVHVGTENGGVQVGTSLPGQPLVGARADRSGVCVGFSYQIPFCLPVSLS